MKLVVVVVQLLILGGKPKLAQYFSAYARHYSTDSRFLYPFYPGIFVDIIDENGHSVNDNGGDYLVIKKPFPSQIRTIWNNPERFVKSYHPEDIGDGKYYIAGDSAHRDEHGYYHILGRVDDVLNVSGHRLGTMEIESALGSNPKSSGSRGCWSAS